mmetsp:Transcript_11865/g.13669  ORF Transcript_11865/g.13669 Transcript_11865/m.13669 type:complete len:251 (+) Transcript_11865:57-809(+)
MSSDVGLYDDELKALEDQMGDLLRALDRLTGEQRIDKYNKAQDILKRLNKTFYQFKVEVRLLEGQEQGVYDKKSQAHNKIIQDLKEQLQQKRADGGSMSAAGGDASNGSPTSATTPGGRRNDGKDDARATAGRIQTTQKKTIESLTETEKLINESENIGTDAVGKLQSQTNQIRQMNDNLDQLDSDINRAKKELNAFIRRMMTDKIILCFAVLVVIGIIVIVVLKVKSGSSSSSSPASAPVQTASPTPSP